MLRGHCHPTQQQGSPLSGPDVVAARPGGSVHAWHTSRENSREVAPNLYFHRDPEEIEKEEQGIAGKAVTEEEFQGEWTSPVPEFTATKPKVAD